MSVKQCNECGEMVDDARAFCPGCGGAFVIERESTESSAVERSDSTIQFSETMYGDVLSDMGLNISKAPVVVEARVEPAARVRINVDPPIEVRPIKPVQSSEELPRNSQQKPVANSKVKWFLAGGVFLVMLFLLILVVVALIFIFWSRLS